jgi:6-phosphogluconolactonase
VEEAATAAICESIARMGAERGRLILGLCGGRSAEGIFRRLAACPQLPWKQTHLFMVDERMVPLDHPDSNFALARIHLITPLVKAGLLPPENSHPLELNPTDPESGVAKLTKMFDACGDRFDIALLSAGEDGHIAGLYPNHHSIRSNERLFLTMEDSPKPPPNRLTSSRALLGRSRACVLLFMGEAKRAALDRFLSDPIDVESCPAQIVRQIGETHVFTDLH